jgi:hypothetical protein
LRKRAVLWRCGVSVKQMRMRMMKWADGFDARLLLLLLLLLLVIRWELRHVQTRRWAFDLMAR